MAVNAPKRHAAKQAAALARKEEAEDAAWTLDVSVHLWREMERNKDKKVLSGEQLLALLGRGEVEVHGHVVLRGKDEAEEVVRQLPEGLNVNGCLVVVEAAGASLAFPQLLTVSESLHIADAELEGLTFGKSLCVGGHLDVANIIALRALPKVSTVGDLNAQGCSALTSIPEGFEVDGFVDLTGCSALTALPKGFHASQALRLVGCTGLTSVLQDLHVVRLNLSQCTAIASMPRGLKVASLLDLSDCLELEKRHRDDTDAFVRQLQAAMGASCSLRLCGWTSLRQLPDGLRVGGMLDLSRCTSLTSLPKGTRIGGVLGLQGCESLTSLPEDLRVGGDLALHDCTALTGLPEDLQVSGDVYLQGCTALESLPASILAWPVREDTGKPHDVFLGGSGLSREAREALREARAPGLQVYVDLCQDGRREPDLTMAFPVPYSMASKPRLVPVAASPAVAAAAAAAAR